MRYKVTRTTAGNGQYFDPDVKPWPPQVMQLATHNGILVSQYLTSINCSLVFVTKGSLLIYDAMGNVIDIISPGPNDPSLRIEREIDDRVWEQVR